jgi:hypothetical protein
MQSQARSGLHRDRRSGQLVNRTRAAILLLFISAGAPAAEADTVRLLISFGSQCCGTDHQALEEVSKAVSALERQTGRSLAQERISWGKEGEFNLCLPLTELDVAGQRLFVARIKTALVKSKLTQVLENAPCAAAWPPGGSKP